MDVLGCMPKGWPPAYVGLFPGRPGSPLRIGGYLNGSVKDSCAADPTFLGEQFWRIGFTAFDGDMLRRCAEFMALAPGIDFQFDIMADGSLGDTFGLSLSFNETKPRQARACMESGYVEELEAFVKALAEESGNDIKYYPAPVSGSDVADERGEQVGLLCGSDANEVGVRQEAGRFRAGRGHYCGAHMLWSVGVDEKGNLQKCWEAVDKPQISFGTAHDWDPADPLRTASRPDNLTMCLNTACPVPDDECRACVWLPMCVGGCPHRRLFGARTCVAFRDDPEAYVLALHARIGEGKNEEGRGKPNEPQRPTDGQRA